MKNHDRVMIGIIIFTLFQVKTINVILIGILAALFFSVTFILNPSMELDGGSWVWSASFRFMFMLPILFIIVGYKRNVKPVLIHMKKQPIAWLLWSTVGFGLFYAPLDRKSVV